MNEKKCPFCKKLNEIDNKFCVYCGKKFQLNENASESGVSTNKDELKNAEEESCLCPKCNTLNSKESIECGKCGYLFKKDIEKSFPHQVRKYRRCPRCGNILPSYADLCNICGYYLSDLKIGNESGDGFFKQHPECLEYEKNLDFFKDINSYHDYDDFIFQFKEFCRQNNIDLNSFDEGMVKCPQCSDYFSFISPHFIKTHNCPHCGGEFEFEVSKDACCLNCGRPVKDTQSRCPCGYELADITCPKCKTPNSYTNSYCISCANPLRQSNEVLKNPKARGCFYDNDDMLILSNAFLRKESLKDPYNAGGGVHSDVLISEYLKHVRIITEIASRWLIVSPFSCKNCQSEIDAIRYSCPKCDTVHRNSVYSERISLLKTVGNIYVKPAGSIDELSNLKWTYKLTESDMKDYLNSLAPQVGELQSDYRRRLLREYGENCAISYLIQSDMNIYFKDICMSCGSKFEPYNLYCPSCGKKKEVLALGVLLNNDSPVEGAFSRRYAYFSHEVKSICRDKGGDVQFADEGVVSCPNCSNYFHYLTQDFVDTQKCPHCGTQFMFDAEKRNVGGYCGHDCLHCREEIIDVNEGIVADYTDNYYTEYYCSLGHSLSRGKFCKDYE